jgi:hypothetical protein
MSADRLDYDKMVQEALRGVVRRALETAAKRGLPGTHHFYLTFRTGQAGVGLADWLKTRYPEVMTIVIEHQFWDLEVGKDAFSVTLSFNNAPERITVPFAALTRFADPSVKFGLQFEAEAAEPRKTMATEPDKPVRLPQPVEGAAVVALDSFRKKT